MKKYELTGTFTTHSNGEREFRLYRVEALIDIPRHSVKKGDQGGFIECEENLSHQGDCWIGKDSHVFDESCVRGNAFVEESTIFGGTTISENAIVRRTRFIGADSHVFGDCEITDTMVHGKLISSYDTTIKKTEIFGELTAVRPSILVLESTFHGAVRLSENTHIGKSRITNIHFGAGEQRIRISTLEANDEGQVQGAFYLHNSHVSAEELLIETATKVHFHNVKATELKKIDVRSDVEIRQVYINPGADLRVNHIFNEGIVSLEGTLYKDKKGKDTYGIHLLSEQVRIVHSRLTGDIQVHGDWELEDTVVQGVVHLDSKNEHSTILKGSSIEECASVHIPFSSRDAIHIDNIHLQRDEVYTAVF